MTSGATSGALSPSPSGIGVKTTPSGQGDPNDMVLRFEPFPPPKPPKDAPPPTPEEIQRVRKETLADATIHMEEFVALLRHFNPYIVVREKLPHGIVSRMPLKLDKPPGKGPQIIGPPTLVSDPLTEADKYPPEDSDPELDDPEPDEEVEEVEERAEEEEPEVLPPPPPPPEEPDDEDVDEPEYVSPPINRPSTPPPPPLAEPSFYIPANEDDLSYPSFPGYDEVTKVKDLFAMAGMDGAEAANDPTTPLAGPPYAVAGSIKAFPIAYNTLPFTDNEVALETVHTTVAVEVIRAVKKTYNDKLARAKAKARHEDWARKAQLAAMANLPVPSAPMDGSEDSDQETDMAARPGALLPVPAIISPPSVEAIYNSLQSPYEQEDLRTKESLVQRRIFIESQLSYLEVDVLPQLLARRKRADDLLQEMASSARLRGQVLAPTSRLAHPNYDRHVNLAVIIFDICRTRKQKLEHNEMLEAERVAGVYPSGHRRPQYDGDPLL